MMEILEKDLSSIKTITAKAATSAQKYEKLIVYIESEVQRTKAKDIKSIAQDLGAIQNLAYKS